MSDRDEGFLLRLPRLSLMSQFFSESKIWEIGSAFDAFTRDRSKFIECKESNFLIWSELRESRVLAVHAEVTQLLTESQVTT